MLGLGVGILDCSVREQKGGPGGDVTPPAAVTDFELLGPPAGGEAIVQWTVPGDDGMTGNAHSFDIRQNDFEPVSLANWNSSPSAIGGWVIESTAPGLGRDYLVIETIGPVWMAIRYRDEVGNISGLSNVLQITDWG